MKSIHLLFDSLLLDINFFKISPWPFSKKVKLILHKYLLTIKHVLSPFVLGESRTQFYDQTIYYASRYGLADFQATLVHSQRLIQLAKIKQIKTVIDIGANIGSFSMLINDLYPRSTIHAFEPIPSTFNCLQSNLGPNKRIITNNLGISSKNGWTTMKHNPNKSVISSIVKKGNIKVKLTTIDSYIEKNNIKFIDLLKIDAEGHELEVLKGAKKTLSKTKYLLLEVTVKNNKNYTFSELISHLYSPEKYNFQLISYSNNPDIGLGEASTYDFLMKNVQS